MKTMQWIGAILALAGVIFGVTFVMNFLGGDSSRPEPAKSPEIHKVSFATKVQPQSGLMLQCEVGQSGQQDFWFHNDSRQATQVGMAGKSCTCSEAEIYLPPESWQKQLPLQTAALVGLLTGSRNLAGGDDLVAVAATAAWNEVLAQQAEQAAEKTMLTMQNGVAVPDGAVGWVRVKWHSDKPDTRQLGVRLWMEQEGVGLTELLIGVLITEPMKSDSRATMGTVQEQDLPRTASLRCWSLTRSRFRIEAKVLRERGQASSDPLVVGKPVPLTQAECRKLEEEQRVRLVRSGYRIPLTLQAHASDGSTAPDLGHFVRTVELSSPDEGIAPLHVPVEGEVLGAVLVGRSQEGALHLGSFRSSRGVRGRIQLETDVPNLKLELDTSRIPSYVKAELEEPETAPSGHRMWMLKVQVLPNRVRGSFPRPDDPEFRDSAVYVKTAGSQTRVIRIPLKGTAYEG